ncbi:IS1634 family transposase [Paenibacillus sp. MZ04-78.2]|uniref:IS1634 family transposase n=1 Tax=Paenibacillus sp. MZ04-78.2 TaxID=2962034 RepID=UPI0020B762DB|nr:IS1634 family transposase [Paenibacillus sp. MZ04-78.2]MCP3773617.1 IS1634 family transposase [Paenibacillus sp. MZ04-78.2]
MPLIYLKNKNNGITYVYESENYWDKAKKQSRSRRTCIGKLDSQTGELIPSKRLTASHRPAKPGPVPVTETKRLYAGATYLLDAIGEKLGITADLKQCFPEQYKLLLSIAYFLILEDPNPLIRFSKWAITHQHPYGKDIPSQRSSDFFASITEEARERFFRLQGRRRAEKEYWAYDTTTLSSYSECLKQVKYGMNKEHDPLPQINLALLFGEQSNLPFYYRKLPGNISDVQTVKKLLADMDFLTYKKIKLVMDRGFYSEANINAMYQHHLKFLIGVKVTLKYVQEKLESARPQLQKWENFHPDYNLYAQSTTITWKYTQRRPYKGDVLEGERRAYLHLYFNKEKETEDAYKLNRLLAKLKAELESGKRDPEHEKSYAKYFEVKSTPKRGTVVKPKQEVIDAAVKNYGYFALLSNEIKDPIEALVVYRNKDLVEKAFGNLKERLNFRRMEVSSERSLDGKLFVEFVALIYLSYIKKVMREKKLFQRYTMQGLLDELDVIECYERPGRDLKFGEITRRQIELYEALEISAPASL